MSDPMTLAEAVAVLNRERHRDHAAWGPSVGGFEMPSACIYGPDDPQGYPERLTAFEAIAIAEKYEAASATTLLDWLQSDDQRLQDCYWRIQNEGETVREAILALRSLTPTPGPETS